jgi:hypothetical protein
MITEGMDFYQGAQVSSFHYMCLSFDKEYVECVGQQYSQISTFPINEENKDPKFIF